METKITLTITHKKPISDLLDKVAGRTYTLDGVDDVSAAFDEAEEELDDYGNPTSGDRLINCCFPDCGCDGARLCMAEKGASGCAMSLNIERGSR